jgi:Ca-activated chloride channel family protein
MHERQSASGMREEPGRDPIEVTVDALLVLLRLGITTSHPTAGAQTKKAVDALLAALAATTKVAPHLAELALAALWLLSTGPRTRIAIKDATAARPGLEDLAAALGRDELVRAHVERIAPMC